MKQAKSVKSYRTFFIFERNITLDKNTNFILYIYGIYS